MALSYINNKEIKFGSSKPLNGVYTPGSPTREYEPLDSLGIYLNSGIPLSYGVENGRYMSMSDEFVASCQGNSYSFNQFFAAQMMLGFKLHDRFIACDAEHKIIGTEPLLHKAYLAEITEKTLDYFKIKIYENKTRTYCIRMSSSEVPTSYVDLTNSFDENGLNLTQTDRQSFLSYYRFYPLTARDFSSRAEETLGVDYYLLPSAEGLRELSRDILPKFNAFISSEGSTLTNLGNTAFAYAGDINYVLSYKGETPEAAVSAAKKAEVILGQVEEMHADINQILPEMEENLELTKQYRDEAMSTEIGTVREDLNQLKGDLSAEQRARESADNTFRADLTANANADAVTRRSLDALWKLNQGISYQFESDDSVAYSKTVPIGAKLASVQNIGGKTEVIDAALVSADVRALNVIGKNVFPENVSEIIQYGSGYNGFEIGGLIPSAVYTVSVSNTDYVRRYGKIFHKDGEIWIGHSTIDSLSIKAGIPKKVIATDRGTISIRLNINYYTSVEEFMTIARESWQDLQIEIGENATGYSPYHSKTIPLPDAVCALPGYGWSVGEVCNAIERTDDGWQYVQRVGSREYQEGDTVTDGVTTYYVMDIPVVTDITDLMTDFQAYFEVEAGGTITMENAAMLPVPNTEKYIIALKEVNG